MAALDQFLRKRKANSLEDKAIDLELDDKFAEAAQAYSDEATAELPLGNELIFADDCIDSFKNWLKAGNIENALNQARRALQGYMLSDWLKDEEYLKAATDMVVDMRNAGHLTEADALLTDINNGLKRIGEKPVSVMVMCEEHDFPEECPHCGAAVTYRGNLDEIVCRFCGGAIHAVSDRSEE